MAYGQVNTPGASGTELVAARQLAQQALDGARDAQTTASGAQSTADAALEKANSAEQTAGAAGTTAAAALEKANANATTITQVGQTASSALETANKAKQDADTAKTAAENAAAAADAAAQAVTKLTSVINSVPSQSGSLTYTGSAQAPSWNGYDAEKLTIGGTTSGTNAGSYSATFTPKEGYEWADGTKTAKTVTWTIGKASLTIPTQKGSLTYTGSAQSPTWNNYDSSKLTIGGTTSGTNATSYTATFTPGSNYQWSDGSTGAKNVSWSIGKKAGSFSLNKTSMSLNVSALTGTITVTREGDGAITASSSNTSVATVSVSGTTVTVTAKANGNATITVNVAAGTNHTAPASKTCAVKVDMASASLADNTPETIQAAAKAGIASNYWRVGDKLGIALNGTVGALTLNSTYYAFILGFNHNSGVEGGNSIHFQFGKTNTGVDIAFCDAGYNNYYSNNGSSRFVMNTTNTNSGGWNGSYMRNTICPAFLNAMPAAWRNVIAACTKYSDNTGGGSDAASYVTATSDKIWLLSEFEVFGSRSGANSAEQNYQKQYDYYKNGNSRVKYQHGATGSACYWWLRSVRVGHSSLFRGVITSGGYSNGSAHYSLGFAPGFKVA